MKFSILRGFSWGATPFITQKHFCSVYRVHGTQNDRLELTVSKQKSVLKNMYRIFCIFLKSRTPQLKPLKIENFNDFPKLNIIYPNNNYQPDQKCDFFNFQPTLMYRVYQIEYDLLCMGCNR